MLITDIEVSEKMESPINLMNRLNKLTKQRSHENIIPMLPPKAEDLIKDIDEKLNYGSIKSKAANIMIKAMDELNNRIGEVTKPEQLARITESMSKIVTSETERNEDDNRAQIIVYAPQVRNESHYETLVVNE